MPAISPSEIVNSLLDAIQQSGGNGYYVSESDRTHPRKFFVSQGENRFYLWVYIWTVTHGGRASLPNEYRIQMTSVSSPLQFNPNGYTVLLGYFPDLGLFAGFDLQRHHIFTTGSPSVQINISAFHDALQNGFGFSTKDNREIAVGIRPDQFLNYIYNSIELHQSVASHEMYQLIQRASKDIVADNDIETLSSTRKTLVSNVRRYSRDGKFKKSVLSAYENRCAVTRWQLKLVEAAHILPVKEEGSVDHISNGIALSPTIHKAFDSALIYLDEEYHIRINSEKESELRSAGLDDGLNQLHHFCNRQIHLPHDPNQRPNIDFIREANKIRRIPGF